MVGEELGLVGAVCVLLLLGALRLVRPAGGRRGRPDRFGGLLGVGLVAWIAAETIINVGAVVGLLPVTGIPLPFISYGGSSLVITLLAAGILVNIARRERTTPAADGRTAPWPADGPVPPPTGCGRRPPTEAGPGAGSNGARRPPAAPGRGPRCGAEGSRGRQAGDPTALRRGGRRGHRRARLQALAVARALVARGHSRETIELVGSRRGQEATLLAR